MAAFASSVALSTRSHATIGSSKFLTSLPTHSDGEISSVAVPTMALRTGFARKTTGVGRASFGGMASVYEKAGKYMAKSVRSQYLQMANPKGTYNVTCTEGTVKFAAEGTRVRALGLEFRSRQANASKKYGDMYEYRKQALAADHICNYESKLFCNYSEVSETYCTARSEAGGTCERYASPDSIEEAAMVRYMDIQQKIAVNPSGVYSTSCNEGTYKGQAEDLRVAALATAYRNGMKPIGAVLQEKYNQRKFGHVMTRGCSYEDGLITNYPALGAGMRSKSAGY